MFLIRETGQSPASETEHTYRKIKWQEHMKLLYILIYTSPLGLILNTQTEQKNSKRKCGKRKHTQNKQTNK